MHTNPQLVLMPWGYSDIPCPGYDRMFELAARANEALFDTHGTVYQVHNVQCTLHTVHYPVHTIPAYIFQASNIAKAF